MCIFSFKGFDELLQLAEEGDHRNVDMLVSDIYGGDYSGMGLPGDLIACSFGKAIHSSKDKNFNPGELFYVLKISIYNVCLCYERFGPY